MGLTLETCGWLSRSSCHTTLERYLIDSCFTNLGVFSKKVKVVPLPGIENLRYFGIRTGVGVEKENSVLKI